MTPNLNGVENVSDKTLEKLLHVFVVFVLLLALALALFGRWLDASADSAQPEPELEPTSLPIAVQLVPGDEVMIYCAGSTLRVENVDDRTGVARCSNDLEPEIYWPAVQNDPANRAGLAQDGPIEQNGR